MKKNILGIVASPRKLGNCEIFIKEISRNFTFDFTLNLIRLSDFQIQPCIGCYACLSEPHQCRLKDDLGLIIKALTAADALIVAVPTYFLGPNGMLKLLLDRGLSFYAHTDKLSKTPAIGIGIAGIKGKEGYTLLGIDSFLKGIFAEIKHRRMVYGALPGEVFLNRNNQHIAKDMAKMLFSEKTTHSPPCCPLCQGDTFRLLGENQIQCMLCSNKGTMDFHTNRVIVKVVSDGHDFTLSANKAAEHRLWLKDMTRRFVKEKSKLKKIVIDYRKDGVWIKPES